jgi:hypothetical protein
VEHERRQPEVRRPEVSWLRWAAALYALGLVVHTIDHVRRGLDAVTPQVLWLGNVSTILGVVAVLLIFTDNRYAAAFAAATGLAVGVGVVAVHLLPRWSEFSDAFPDATGTGVTPLSWTVVLIEIAGALAMGVGGTLISWQHLRRRVRA